MYRWVGSAIAIRVGALVTDREGLLPRALITGTPAKLVPELADGGSGPACQENDVRRAGLYKKSLTKIG